MNRKLTAAGLALLLAAGLTAVATPAAADEYRGGGIACGTSRTHGTSGTWSASWSIKHTSTGGYPYFKSTGDHGVFFKYAYRNWGVHYGNWDWSTTGNLSGSLANTCYN